MRHVDTPLPADQRAADAADKPVLSRDTRIELLVVLCVLFFFLTLKPAIERWLEAKTEAVQTSALGRCRPPAEFEQLHVVVLNRGGRLVLGDCMFVGSKGTYTR